MINYPTRAELRSLVSKMSLQEQASARKSAEERSPNGATFLSHSSRDSDILPGAIQLLQSHGATVYVDKKDPALPPYTTTETAETLKTRINQSKKFVLLASENSKESRWVPWELGLADGYKGIHQVAILPTVETRADTSWTKWEYLGLYRRIVWGTHEDYKDNIWMVLDHKTNTATELGVWLRRP